MSRGRGKQDVVCVPADPNTSSLDTLQEICTLTQPQFTHVSLMHKSYVDSGCSALAHAGNVGGMAKVVAAQRLPLTSHPHMQAVSTGRNSRTHARGQQQKRPFRIGKRRNPEMASSKQHQPPMLLPATAAAAPAFPPPLRPSADGVPHPATARSRRPSQWPRALEPRKGVLLQPRAWCMQL